MSNRFAIPCLLSWFAAFGLMAAPSTAFAEKDRAAYVQEAKTILIDAAGRLDQKRYFKPEDVGPYYAESMMEVGVACLAKVDEALKNGVDGGVVVEVDGKNVTLKDGREQICQALVDWMKEFGGQAEAARKAEFDRKAKPYRDVGIKGKRLELFAKESFQGPGCGGFIEDPKKLKKAKVLYQLIEGNDGYGLHKYVFKGDNYSRTTHWFNTRGARNAACK